jgi:hypothetical protein
MKGGKERRRSQTVEEFKGKKIVASHDWPIK